MVVTHRSVYFAHLYFVLLSSTLVLHSIIYFCFFFFFLAISGVQPDSSVQFHVITVKTLKNKIEEKYANLKANLIEILRNVEYVCLTGDIWSASGNTRSFLGATTHWIDEVTLERRSAVLLVERFKSPHTNDRIAEMIRLLTDEFELTQKVVATVTDNGANFVKCFREFGITFEHILKKADVVGDLEEDTVEDLSFEFVEFDSQGLSAPIRCASHTLNLVAMKDANKALDNRTYQDIQSSAFAKTNFIWRKSNTQNGAQEIREIVGSLLIKPNLTRWNSFFDSLSDLKKKGYDKINKALRLLGSEPFTEDEMRFLDEYLTVMEHIAKAIDNLQQTNCYFAILMPTIHSTKYLLEKLHMSNTLRFCKPLLLAVIEGLDKRFGHLFDFFDNESTPALIATCSHPFFKTRWINERLKTENCLRHIESLLEQAALDIKTKSNNLPEANKPDSVPSTHHKEGKSKNSNAYFKYLEREKAIVASHFLISFRDVRVL